VEGALNVGLHVIGMLCRSAERGAGGPAGTQALARELADRGGVEARLIGTPQAPRSSPWEEDLRDAHGCLLEAGGQVEDALEAGGHPILLAADCSVAIATLPSVVRCRPGATILWLDAHGDFNTPDTTISQYLGGMGLAAACGVWDAGLGLPRVDPAAVVMCGVRDLDGGELVLLETHGVARVSRPAALAGALAGRDVYVHLDLDVLDPSVLPAFFPVAGGLSDGGLRTLLSEVAESCEVIGAEITGFATPELVELVATIADPLLP
jgi:arginase family enzyme